MRISTQSIMNRYNRNLSNTIGNLDKSRIRVLTNRSFNSIAEDPASATKSFKLRREYNEISDQINNVEDTLSLYDNLAAGALDVSTMLSQEVNESVLQGMNGSTSLEARKAYAQALRGVQENIVLSLNAKYADRHLYGGASTKEPPFAFDKEKNILTYRGLDVNSNDPAVQKQIKDMVEKETLYVDLGFGLTEDAGGDLIKGTAFDTAVSGLEIIGYGKNADGTSKNAVVLLGEIADALEDPTFNQGNFDGLMKRYHACKNEAADYVAELGTKCKFLEDTKVTLERNQFKINEQILSVEEVDTAAAISDYIWQQYAYNAALKVGTSILSPSFIDFMK